MPRTPERLVDAQIAEARANGAFDLLSGHGKPLDLDELNHLPADQRVEALLLRSTGEVAIEVALVRAIRDHRAKLASSTSDEERERLQAALQHDTEELMRALKERRAEHTKTREERAR